LTRATANYRTLIWLFLFLAFVCILYFDLSILSWALQLNLTELPSHEQVNGYAAYLAITRWRANTRTEQEAAKIREEQQKKKQAKKKKEKWSEAGNGKAAGKKFSKKSKQGKSSGKRVKAEGQGRQQQRKEKQRGGHSEL
jgi:hypothetical protein